LPLPSARRRQVDPIMPNWLRRSLYSSLGLLWLSGLAWLILHLFFARESQFGVAPHPWQPKILLIHGVLAVAATFLFGWIAGSHVGANWRRGVQRISGVTLIALLVILALTGVGSYYLTWDAARSVNSLLHESAGVLAIVPALVHWAVARR
jgi:uncharacterized membrane protein